MKNCDENQNLMSTLLPFKNCACAAYSGIENFNTEGRFIYGRKFFFLRKEAF